MVNRGHGRCRCLARRARIFRAWSCDFINWYSIEQPRGPRAKLYLLVGNFNNDWQFLDRYAVATHAVYHSRVKIRVSSCRNRDAGNYTVETATEKNEVQILNFLTPRRRIYTSRWIKINGNKDGTTERRMRNRCTKNYQRPVQSPFRGTRLHSSANSINQL